MTFDEYGLLWLTDPWLTAATFLVVLGTLLWSHRWIAAGRMPRLRSMAVRIPRERRVPRIMRAADVRALGRRPTPAVAVPSPAPRRLRPVARRPRADAGTKAA
jgi:hypothetical protein